MKTSKRKSTKDFRRKACFIHFKRRLAERVSEVIDPLVIWDGIISSIEQGDPSLVSFVARTNRNGRRVWRVGVEAVPFFVIFDHELGCPVTVLPPDGEIIRTNRNNKKKRTRHQRTVKVRSLR